MSPRAACRLEALGFVHVHDYVPGKVDWFARGLPRDGDEADEPRAGDVARRDVATALLTDRAGDVRARVEARARLDAGGLRTAVVTTPDGVLLGVVRRGEPRAGAGERPGDAEPFGPPRGSNGV